MAEKIRLTSLHQVQPNFNKAKYPICGSGKLTFSRNQGLLCKLGPRLSQRSRSETLFSLVNSYYIARQYITLSATVWWKIGSNVIGMLFIDVSC